MSSPGQKRGSCGHAMAIFDGHTLCAHCREKGKVTEPCITDKDTVDCKFCNSLTPEQWAQISTPSYKLKKEKREAKHQDNPPTSEDYSLVDPTTVSVIGAVGDTGVDKSPAIPPEKKSKKEKQPVKTKKDKPSSLSVDRFTELDQKWSERFNRLEALLLSKSLQPTFSSEVRVTPSHSPPTTVARDTEPFFQPTSRTSELPFQHTGPDISAVTQHSAGTLPSQDIASGNSASQRTGPDSNAAQQLSAGKLSSEDSTSSSSTSRRTGPDTVALEQKSAGKPKLEQHQPKSSVWRTGPDTDVNVTHKSTGKPHTDLHRPATKTSRALSIDPPLTDHSKPASTAGSGSLDLQKASRRDSISSLESAADSVLSDRPPVELFVEEGELSDEQECTEQDLPTSEEQTYRETMRVIRSFMGWSHVPDVDSSNPSDDSHFAGPKTPAPSKVSVHMPTEEWLCKKLSKLNVTLVEGYLSRTTEAGSLPMGTFLRPPRSQSKWYGLYSNQPDDPTKVSSWYT